MEIDKTNITKAFRELRTKGYFARQNFMCCSGCGNAAIPEHYTKAVFYHKQDNETLLDLGYCYLTWTGDGNEIVNILNKNNIPTIWNNENDTRIKIFLV